MHSTILACFTTETCRAGCPPMKRHRYKNFSLWIFTFDTIGKWWSQWSIWLCFETLMNTINCHFHLLSIRKLYSNGWKLNAIRKKNWRLFRLMALSYANHIVSVFFIKWLFSHNTKCHPVRIYILFVNRCRRPALPLIFGILFSRLSSPNNQAILGKYLQQIILSRLQS